mmetsp:Transcript_23897/g.52198  ORF Transcript_23897/g.52198 Transcript_23897/m.52198 type:complete len:288 (+) Transcript_23897:186-1049(+)|eukprot:CAMPEP_0118934820 /NCGR_PEP_ID=MMETSP1169-20130426/14217_1 /TAXON_ID=36882 /ORGANISM="Pyramimonas obovata, Strain CCMP722" /LENGTH=287 /DNA_ID=CAMNT_0006877759 /DNA_START=183 /DNA_END=1046 /DNA_ORIENTATION=+
MEQHVYDDICSSLKVYGRDYPDMDAIQRRHPGVVYDTLLSIYSQECTRRVQTSIRRVGADENLEKLEQRFLNGESVAHICHDIKTPPCVLLRLLLARILGVGKQVVSRCLKDPRLVLTLPCKKVPLEDQDRLRLRISADIELCNYTDPVFSPYVDGLRNQVGREFEAHLEEQLRKAGIAFRGEEELRAEGQAKTPDVKLDIPIAVRGKIVNWIDSKASFCDQWTYKHKGLEQFQGYVNRYGPGMVIYWFGYLSDLNNHPDVFLTDDFPAEEDIICLAMPSSASTGSV